MMGGDWQAKFDREIKMAEMARSQGNEGKARVCARRAAGVVVGEYLQQQGVSTTTVTAYDRIRMLADWPDLPPGVSDVVDHMTMRVDMDYQLPSVLDLVSDARWLAETLLPASSD